MTHTLSKDEQAALAEVLRQPVIRKALSEALGLIQMEKANAGALEAAAMAYNFNEGASGMISKLFWMADIKEAPTPTPRGFRRITT